MAVTFDAGTAATGTGSFTFSHTVANQSDRVLIVGVATGNGWGTVSGVTYNSTALTNHYAAARVVGGDGANRIYLWIGYLIAPSTGSNTVSVTCSGSEPYMAGAMSFYGCAQNTTDLFTGAATVSADIGDDTYYSIDVPSTNNGMVFDFCGMDTPGANIGSRAAGQTERTQADNYGRLEGTTAAGDGGNVDMDGDWAGSNDVQLAVGLCIQPPQDVSVTPAVASVTSSAIIGTVDDGNISINMSGRPASAVASATIGAIYSTQTLDGEIVLLLIPQ